MMELIKIVENKTDFRICAYEIHLKKIEEKIQQLEEQKTEVRAMIIGLKQIRESDNSCNGDVTKP